MSNLVILTRYYELQQTVPFDFEQSDVLLQYRDRTFRMYDILKWNSIALNGQIAKSNLSQRRWVTSEGVVRQ